MVYEVCLIWAHYSNHGNWLCHWDDIQSHVLILQRDEQWRSSSIDLALTINLEPIYGIVMACFLFGETEKMSGGFYIGTVIILTAVMGYPLYRYFQKKGNRKEATLIQID